METGDVGTWLRDSAMMNDASGRRTNERHAETFSILQQGKGLIKVNGQPLSLVQPEILRFKVRYSPPTRLSL